MEILTIDILAAVINSLKYANPEQLYILKKTAALSHLLAVEIDEEVAYVTFMAALLKDMGAIGIFGNDLDKRMRPYLATEMIRTMPEIMPFQYRIADIVLENRERIDGGGYPAAKENISLEAKIIGAAEDYNESGESMDVLNSSRHETDIIKNLEKVVAVNNNEEILRNNDRLNDYVGDCIRKYNVYKNELDSVESEHFLETIASFIDAKHKYTSGHSKRVATYTYVIAKNMGYDEEKLLMIRYAAYLHDIGKLATKIDLLDKTGKLTEEEYEEIKSHAKYSFEILNGSERLKQFAFGALHHERIDGKGYPFGLKGDEIPEGAKIIAAADILDALTSNRPYRKPFTFSEAFELMEMMSGTTLDSKIFSVAKNSFLITK